MKSFLALCMFSQYPKMHAFGKYFASTYFYDTLYTDCQQKAGPSAWTPFHESASAVTQLYKGMLEHFVLLNLHTHL